MLSNYSRILNKECTAAYRASVHYSPRIDSWPKVYVRFRGAWLWFQWTCGFMMTPWLLNATRPDLTGEHHHNDMTFGLLKQLSEKFRFWRFHSRSGAWQGSCDQMAWRRVGRNVQPQEPITVVMWAIGKKLLFMGQNSPARGLERGLPVDGISSMKRAITALRIWFATQTGCYIGHRYAARDCERKASNGLIANDSALGVAGSDRAPGGNR